MPLIMVGPAIEKRGIDTSQLLHATDVLPHPGFCRRDAARSACRA